MTQDSGSSGKPEPRLRGLTEYVCFFDDNWDLITELDEEEVEDWAISMADNMGTQESR
jgi:hypothetical protein